MTGTNRRKKTVLATWEAAIGVAIAIILGVAIIAATSPDVSGEMISSSVDCSTEEIDGTGYTDDSSATVPLATWETCGNKMVFHLRYDTGCDTTWNAKSQPQPCADWEGWFPGLWWTKEVIEMSIQGDRIAFILDHKISDGWVRTISGGIQGKFN